MKRTLFCLLAASLIGKASFAAAPVSSGQSAGMSFQAEEVVSGLGVLWGMAFVTPTKLLITERHGGLQILDLSSGRLTPVTGGPEVKSGGQGGLLDIALPRDDSTSGWIFFTYSKDQQGQGVTTLARAKLADAGLVDWQDLLTTHSATDTGRHFGSRIAFDDAGHLFFSIGDRGVRPNAQDLSTHAGSILRLTLDGKVPSDNPFINRSNALAEIWSYGHRNPQGIAFDNKNKRLWAIEHGPRGGDELNLIKRGANYGWPIVSHGQEYWGPFAVGEGTEKPGMMNPSKVYIPSIAPGSLLLYSGKAFPGWRGNLLAGALKLTHLNRIILDKKGQVIGEERLLEELGERIRALTESAEGWLYLSTDSGRILRLRPATD